MCVVILLFLLFVPCVIITLTCFFPVQILMKKFVTLGTECAEYLKAARASEGDLLFYTLLVSSAFLCFFIILTFPFFPTADALATANAHIVSLEAELEASRKAFDAATAAVVISPFKDDDSCAFQC
jgi:hypothetical protein